MERRNIFAYTENNGRSYPAYLSICAEVDGTTSVTVRSSGNWGRDIATIKLSSEQVDALFSALRQEVS